jgi:hypothetical protein
MTEQIIRNFDGAFEPPKARAGSQPSWFAAIAGMPHRAVSVKATSGGVHVEMGFSPFEFGPNQVARCGIGINVSPEQARLLAAYLLREAELADGRSAIASVEVLPPGAPKEG